MYTSHKAVGIMSMSVYLLHLFQQHISQLVDSEVVGAASLQAVVAPCEQLCQEAYMEASEAVQAGEDGVNHARLQLHLLQLALAEHPLHNAKCPHVVQLCLDQLCGDKKRKERVNHVKWGYNRIAHLAKEINILLCSSPERNTSPDRNTHL